MNLYELRWPNKRQKARKTERKKDRKSERQKDEMKNVIKIF